MLRQAASVQILAAEVHTAQEDAFDLPGVPDILQWIASYKDHRSNLSLFNGAQPVIQAHELHRHASQESNNVFIRIRDDGRGIDLEKVREKAIQKGLIRAEDPVDREALRALIFSAGFSTRQEATDISGRGIGLDVVHKNISKLNGQVTVDSMPGRGSVFTIRLPLSLAIIPALMAEAGGEVYAIPMNSVDERIKVRQEAIHVINNREVVRFTDRVVPVVRLDEFFGFKRSSLQRFYLVILGKSDKRIALAVDRLRGQQEIVIKPYRSQEQSDQTEGFEAAQHAQEHQQ